MKIGDKVEVKLADDSPLYETRWWPERGVKVTGTAVRVTRKTIVVDVDKLGTKGLGLHLSAAEVVAI